MHCSKNMWPYKRYRRAHSKTIVCRPVRTGAVHPITARITTYIRLTYDKGVPPFGRNDENSSKRCWNWKLYIFKLERKCFPVKFCRQKKRKLLVQLLKMLIYFNDSRWNVFLILPWLCACNVFQKKGSLLNIINSFELRSSQRSTKDKRMRHCTSQTSLFISRLSTNKLWSGTARYVNNFKIRGDKS